MAVCVLAAILIAAGFIIFFHASEPSYQGKSLTAWIDDYAKYWQSGLNGVGGDDGHKTKAFQAAFKAMGTNCIPLIFRRLERQESPMRSYYRSDWPKLPKILQRLLPSPKPIVDARTAAMLVDYSGHAPLELLLQETKSSSSTAREVAVQGIHDKVRDWLGPALADQIIPKMAALMNDPNKMVRLWSAGVLGMIGPKASNAVPSLILALGDSDLGPTYGSKVAVRAWTTTALGRIGPAAGSAIPALTVLLNDVDPDVRWKAAFAIWQIDSNAETTRPVMLQARPKSLEKWNVDEALWEMGSSAKDPAPALKNNLTGADVNDHGTNANAVGRIDSGAVAKAGVK